MSRVIVSVLLVVSLALPLALALPQTALAQTKSQALPPTPETRPALPVQPPSAAVPELQNLSLENWAAIGGGAIVGAVIIDTIGGGALAQIGGAIIGGLFGSWYYDQNYWPFQKLP